MLQGEQDDRGADPRMELRSNRGDKLHDLQLLRDLAIVNACTVRELGPFPANGLPMQPKRKPDLPHLPESLAVQEDEMNPLQRIAATTTLAASTLAACGEADRPEQPREAAPMPTSTVPVAAAPAAPSAPNPPPPSASPEPVADAAKAEIKRGRAISAAELRKQVLMLLENLRTLDDMEHERVAAIFNVPLTKDPERRDGYEYFGRTTEGWNYRIAVMRLGRLSEPPTITIGLNNGVKPWTDQKPTYCTLDFEALAGDIVALGYERDAKRVFSGAKPLWGFGRDVRAQRTAFGVGVYLYYLDEDTESERACVREVQIGGDVMNG